MLFRSGDFGGLPSLVKLELQNNQIATLPNSFGNLSNLGYLDITNNRLTGFPDDFGKLSKLQTLFAQSQNGQLSRISEASFS